MSAWVVSRKHIDLMVTVAVRGTRDGIVPPSKHDPDALGAMLWAENVASVNYRYSESDAVEPYTWADPKYTPTAGELYAAVRCYEYQSCEHPGWATSEAFRLCEQVGRIIRAKVPEAREVHSGGRAKWADMDGAPWGWDVASVAIAYAKNDPEGVTFLWALRADRTDATTLAAFSDWLIGRGLLAEPLAARDLPYEFPPLPEPTASFKAAQVAKAKPLPKQQTGGVHVRTWAAGQATVTEMTNAGKRGKKCRTVTFHGWVNTAHDRESEPGRSTNLALSVLHWLKDDVKADASFDAVAAELKRRVAEAGLPTHCASVAEGETRGIDAPRPKLTAGVEGLWGASADETGVTICRHNDVNGWAEITGSRQTATEAYRLAAKAWPRVRAATTFDEASEILTAAGCKLHGYCMMD
jgi:hypothetical protein